MTRFNYCNAKAGKSKKNLMKIFVVLLLVMIITSIGIVSNDFEADKLTDNYVSVDEAALALRFRVYSIEEWQDFFKDYKETYITREMVSDILTQLGTIEVIPFEEAEKKKAVTRAEWNNIYGQLVDYLDIENQISIRNVLVLASEAGEQEHLLYTSEGAMKTMLPVTYFSDWAGYDMYILGDECIGVVGKSDEENVISNTYILNATEDTLTFLFDERTYEKKAKLEGQTIEEGVADITISGREVVAIAQKHDFIEGHLLSHDDTTIEIEGYGKISHSERMPVYRAYDIVEELRVSDIVLGNMDVKYIIGENEVCAILITAPAEIAYVRVLLLADDGGKFREDVFLCGNGEVKVTCGDATNVIPTGTLLNVKEYLNGGEETFVLEPISENQLTYICDGNGKKISNGYSGKMEVRQYEKGYCIVNEVEFEEYLYSVVPSEMPSSYQAEALKAQAVCARSYAYIQVMRSDLAAYGAHINDSSSYQVYNNIEKTSASVKAVDETAGMVMLHDGDVIEAYYFSTSMGYTETEETWNPIEGTEVGYLKRVCLNEQVFDGNLSNEEEFKEYLLSESNGYDSDIRFFRWEIKADYAGQTENIKSILNTRREASERHITFYKSDKETQVDSMKKFGDLKGFEVAERSESGSILELLVCFENGYAKVENEYNIRKVLGTGARGITYQNGSIGEIGSILPSAFCTIEKQEDGTYLLCGGGYGHGIGMSQNGANGLAKAGYDYIDILNFFYKDIEVVDIRS